jgi:hypothetical protein
MPGSFNLCRWNRLPLDSAGLSVARVMLRRMEHLDAWGRPVACGGLSGRLRKRPARPRACGNLGLFFRRAVNRAE